MTIISVIVGSTREGRFSEKPAKWIWQHLQRRADVEARIPVATLWAHYTGGDVNAGLAELEAPARTLIDDLLWWTAALKTARARAA